MTIQKERFVALEETQNADRFSLLNPVLNERAARSRRYCIVMSLIALFIGLTEQVPTQILILGLKFNGAHTTTIVWFIFAITAMILLDFICHAAPCVLEYYAEFRYYDIWDAKIDENRYTTNAKTPLTHFGDFLLNKNKISESEYCKNNFFHKHNDKIIFLCWVRIAIEVAVPLIVCVWALYKLLQLT